MCVAAHDGKNMSHDLIKLNFTNVDFSQSLFVVTTQATTSMMHSHVQIVGGVGVIVAMSTFAGATGVKGASGVARISRASLHGCRGQGNKRMIIKCVCVCVCVCVGGDTTSMTIKCVWRLS